MIAVLTGPVHSGKTTLLQRVVDRWADLGYVFSGYLSLTVNGKMGHEYSLLELRSGRIMPFLIRTFIAGAEKTGPYFFVPETLEKARSIISAAGPEEALIVDEIGPRELEGGGIRPALDRVLARPEMRLLITVREDILGPFTNLINSVPFSVVDVRDQNSIVLLEKALFAGVKPAQACG